MSDDRHPLDRLTEAMDDDARARVVDVRRYRPAAIRDCHDEVTP